MPRRGRPGEAPRAPNGGFAGGQAGKERYEREQAAPSGGRTLRQVNRSNRARNVAQRRRLVRRIRRRYSEIPQGRGDSKESEAFKTTQQALASQRARTTNRRAELGLAEHPNAPKGLERLAGDLIPDEPAEIALFAVPVGKAAQVVLRAGKVAKRASRASRSTTALRKAPTPRKAPKRLQTASRKPQRKLEDTAIKPAPKPRRTVRKIKSSAAAKKTAKAAQTKPGRAATYPARHVAKHKVGYGASTAGVGALATARTGDPKQLVEAPVAAAKGIARATVSDPIGTAKTTLRTVPGIVTATGELIANPALSTYRAAQTAVPGGRSYSGKEILQPTKDMAEEQYAGLKEFADIYTSGDEERIAKATKDEYGLAPFLPLPVRALRKPYRKVRDKARVKTAQRRVEGKRKIVRPTKKHPRTEFDPERPVFDYAYKRQQRKKESKRAATARDTIRFEEAGRARETTKQARRASRQLPTKKSKRRLEDGREVTVVARAGDTIGYAVGKGIPRNVPRAKAILDQHIARLDNAKRNGKQVTDADLGSLEAARYLRENIGAIVKNDAYWEAVAAWKERVSTQGYSERARLQEIAIEENVPMPETRRVEMAAGQVARERGAVDRAHRTAIENRNLADRRVKIAESGVRGAKQKLATARRNKKGVTAAQKTLVAAETRLKEMKAERAELRKAELAAKRDAAPYARKGSRRRLRRLYEPAYGEAAIKRYESEVRAAIEEKGYAEPGWRSHPDVRLHPEGPDATATGAQISALGRMAADRERSGALAKMGAIDERFDAQVSASIRAPVTKRRIFAMWRDFLNERTRGFDGRKEVTSKQVSGLLADGRMNLTDFALIPEQLYKRVFKALKHDNFTDADFETSIVSPLRDLAADTKNIPEGRTYRVVPREALTELMAQTEREASRGMKALNTASHIQSRLLLGTSPGWAVMQVIAEELQGQVAVSRSGLPGPAPFYQMHFGKAVRAARALPDEDAWGYAAMAGESPGTRPNTSDLRTRLESGDVDNARGALSAINQTPVGRAARSVVTLRALGKFDIWKAGQIRKGVSAVHIDRQINGFLAGVKNLWRAEDDIFKKLRGKTRLEQQSYFAKNPKAAREVQRYVDDMMGNWNAMTRYERLPAGLAMFYPFMRMSLRYVFKALPERHPGKATILYTLGSVHQKHLAELLQGDPGFFAQWAQIPIYVGSGEEEVRLVDLSRAAPGGNALVEALGDSDDPLLTASRAAQPLFGAAITAITGKQVFGPEVDPDILARGEAAMAQLLQLPAPVRLMDQLDVKTEIPGLKQASNLVNKNEGSTGSQISRLTRDPSLLRWAVPVIPTRLKNARAGSQLSDLYDRMTRGYDAVADAYFEAVERERNGASKAEQREALQRVGRLRKSADRASDELNALQRRYGIPETELPEDLKTLLRKAQGYGTYPVAPYKKDPSKRRRVRRAPAVDLTP